LGYSSARVHILGNPECRKKPGTEFFQFTAEKMAGERKDLAVEWIYSACLASQEKLPG